MGFPGGVDREELLLALDGTDRKRFDFLVRIVLDTERVDTAVALKLGLCDALSRCDLADNDDQVRILTTFDHGLNRFASAYDEASDAGDTATPTAVFTSLDRRCVVLSQPFGPEAFYDLDEDKLSPELPHHALFAVSIDLVVLLTRMSDRIRRLRQIKEYSNADEPGATDS